MVESGECLDRERATNKSVTIQLLEPDYIDESKNDKNIIQGVEYDKATGRIKGFHLHKEHPGDQNVTLESEFVSADKIGQSLDVERTEQARGVPWLAPCIQTLKDLSDYQFADLTRMKLAACTAVFIEETAGDSSLPAAYVKGSARCRLGS
jgi:capsid protein